MKQHRQSRLQSRIVLLMHRAHMLEFEGKSYRLKEAAARIAVAAETTS